MRHLDPRFHEFDQFEQDGVVLVGAHEIGARQEGESAVALFREIDVAVDRFADEGSVIRRGVPESLFERLETQKRIGHDHSAVVIHQFRESDGANPGFHGFCHVVEINVPRRNQFTKAVVIDEANMEIVATLVENAFDGQVEVGLVQIGGRPVLETGPDTRIVLEFGVYPDFGAAVSVEGRIVEEILFDKGVLVFAFFEG